MKITRRNVLFGAASASLLPVLPARAGEETALSEPESIWTMGDASSFFDGGGNWHAGDSVASPDGVGEWIFDGEQWVVFPNTPSATA